MRHELRSQLRDGVVFGVRTTLYGSLSGSSCFILLSFAEESSHENDNSLIVIVILLLGDNYTTKCLEL